MHVQYQVNRSFCALELLPWKLLKFAAISRIKKCIFIEFSNFSKFLKMQSAWGKSFCKTLLTYRWLIWFRSMLSSAFPKLAIMLNWVHLDVLDIVLNLFCFWIVIRIVVIIQWSSICLALSRYLLTGQWRVTVRGSDPCTWYSFKKNIWT